jgi:hypothetical protein
MKTKKMTDAQREAKRERDRRYHAKKRAEAKANKPTKKTAKKLSTTKPVVAKNLKLKVALGRVMTKSVSPKRKTACLPPKEHVRVALIALSALCKFMAAGI